MRVFIYTSLLIFVAAFSCSAQQNLAPPANAPLSVMKSPDTPERRVQLYYARRAREAMDAYLATVPPDSEEYRTTKATIAVLDAKLQNLVATPADDAPAPPRPVTAVKKASTPPKEHPKFFLSVPAAGRTNVATEPTLTWTEDFNNGTFQKDPPYILKKFRLIIAKDPEFTQRVLPGDGTIDVKPGSAESALAPTGIKSAGTSFPLPEKTLESGTQYYWKVIALYVDPKNPDELFEQEGETLSGDHAYFITVLDPFASLTKRRFSLQRSLAAKGPSEGAQFSFLKTFDKNTVYSADFAFFWDSRAISFADERGSVKFRPAVEGKLTSDDTRAEDAWRFIGSAVLDYSFGETKTDEQNAVPAGTERNASQNTIDSLYFELGGSLETDQGFDTKKVASRVFFSPSSRKLAIGTATGNIESPVQFFWRPSVEFNAGHTFAVGDSAEVENTVLRVMPRVRMTLFTRSLSRLLKVADSDLFLDNTFYYLPKEKIKTKHNFFTAGFEVFVVKNFGFGLTYKNGESAPRFRPIRSFGGTLIVGFGPSR